MSTQDLDKLVIDEVQGHYRDKDSPYYLAELGNFFRVHKLDIPEGIRFKDFLKSLFAGRLLVLQNPDNPVKIAVAPPEKRERVRQPRDPGNAERRHHFGPARFQTAGGRNCQG